ncbi:Na+/H+ antiporter [Sphingobacteriaceae bacterium WQ 2009]|uniref:Na+/H+ antiporter n=1 Tax=Rhinopithecimicrobium faecis TaxID=2820698 RepID=A0A8T4HCJ0_9SPHI|nr:Na+/H+ antiporter [Sphingobacteriaceae bacterium WQ 2009]
MIEENLFLILVLFFCIIPLYILSMRIRVSFSIVLVLGGLLISFIPGVPAIKIDPNLVFLIFLPPLLFEAAWYTSLIDFYKWRSEIVLMGFGLVLFTSISVAYFAVWLIPGFTLALGFLLGGIISPPDAVATTSILKGLSMPKKGIAILEGESLINDAASLTIFRFALVSVISGQFAAVDVSLSFLKLSLGGVFIGLLIAVIIYGLLRFIAQKKAPKIISPVTLVAPYLMYLSAEHYHCSGVLSVVSGGLFLSFYSRDFMTYGSRIQTKEVLATVSFLLNGFVFILIGLELPVIMQDIKSFSTAQAISYGLAITALVIVIRLLWVGIIQFFNQDNNSEKRNWKLAFVMGWAGLRGVVSLASALAIPLYLEGKEFPFRNLILIITFTVILITLVFQGLTLPLIMRKLDLREEDDHIPHEQQIKDLQLSLAKHALHHLEDSYEQLVDADGILNRVKHSTIRNIAILEKEKEDENKERYTLNYKLYYAIRMDIIAKKRSQLYQLCHHVIYDDEVVRSVEHSLDLEEARLKNSALLG